MTGGAGTEGTGGCPVLEPEGQGSVTVSVEVLTSGVCPGLLESEGEMPGVTRGVLKVKDLIGVRTVEAGVLDARVTVGVSVGVTVGASGATGVVLEAEATVETPGAMGVRGQSGTSGAQLISVVVEVT